MEYGLCWLAITLGIISFNGLPGVQTDHCTNEQLQECNNFRDDLLNISTGYFLLKELSEDLMDEYCNIFKRVTQSCLEGMMLHCNEESAGRLEGFIDGTLFLCNEGFEDFLALKPCLDDTDTHRQLLICAEQYSIETGNIGSLERDADLKYCQATEELIDCEADALEHTCPSSGAGEWTRTYNTKFYQGYLSALGCIPTTTTTEQESDGIQTWVIVVATIGGVLLLIVLITAAVCIVRKSGKKHNHPAASHLQPQVTVIVDNRHLNPKKHYDRQHSGSAKNHPMKHNHPNNHPNNHNHHHGRRLPRSNSSDSHGNSAQSISGADDNYTSLTYRDESVRYHRDPTSIVERDGPLNQMVVANGVVNPGLDSRKPDVEDDYLHPVGSIAGSKSNVYEELPAQ